MSETNTPEPYLAWVGGLVCLVFMVTLVAVLAITNGWLHPGSSVPAAAAAPLTESTPAVTNTATCADFANSEPRSPAERFLYQDNNCSSIPASLPGADTAECNRKALDPAEFTLVAPELYVFRQTPSSRAYVWYSSSDTCFDLASGKVVAAICADRMMVFKEAESACAAHGGVLAWVNGR